MGAKMSKLFQLVLVILSFSPASGLTVRDVKVMVQTNSPTEFAPLFQGPDTAFSQIVPEVTVAPSHGSISLLPARRYCHIRKPGGPGWKTVPVTWLRYTPESGYTGLDSCVYAITTPSGRSNEARCRFKVHPKEPGGMTVAIVVSERLVTPLSAELNRLKNDLDNEGYRAIFKTYPDLAAGLNWYADNYMKGDSLSKILWDTLRAEYEKPDRFLAGAILVGVIPYLDRKGHVDGGLDEQYWNMSIWLRDYEKDSMFLQFDPDAVAGREDTSFAQTGNGGFQGKGLRHIWVSRFWGKNIRGARGFGLFATAQHDSESYGTETALIRRALDANHDYRIGASRFPHEAFYYNQTASNNIYASAEKNMRQIWPDVFLQKAGYDYYTVRSPGDTLWNSHSVYRSGAAGEMWDIMSDFDHNRESYPFRGGGSVYLDSVMQRPFQQRFVFLNGCHPGGTGCIGNGHLLTRGGGAVLAAGAIDYIGSWARYSIAESLSTKDAIRQMLASGERWGRAWINSEMPIKDVVFHGDLSLKPMMGPANEVPWVDSLVRSAPSAGRMAFTAAARDPDGSVVLYEWWFAGRYNAGRNEPDTVTTVPAIEVDAARCTGPVRLEAVDNYKARFFVELHRDSQKVVYPRLPAGMKADGPAVTAPVAALFAAPNPSNGAVRIAFTASASAWTLIICDLSGRIVRSFGDRDGAGTVNVTWDGRDHSGRKTAPGLYVVRLGNGRNSHSHRLALLK